MAELLALALSCDLTRVFTYQLVKPGSRVAIGSLGFGRYHDITHNEPGDQPKCSATIKLFMRELLVLVETLRAVPEGDGTLLDSCGLLASADCTNPKVHGYKDFPLLAFGGAGGRIRTALPIRGTADGLHVLDLWDSAPHFQRFLETRLMPVVQRIGVKGQPRVEMNEAHAIFAPNV